MNVERIRQDFPILAQLVNGKPLVYLDNAATTQKPRQVIDAIRRYYEEYNANVHRSIHTLGERATAAYEEARAKVAAFIDAPEPATCIFVRNASEGLNLVAYSYGMQVLRPGDEILLSPLEHHSNLVPWQLVARRTGARLRFMPMHPDGTLDLERLPRVLTERTRIVAVAHASNTLGAILPVKAITEAAHAVGAVVVVDGAQSVPHMPVSVRELDVDFLAFSGHKMMGPMGIGVLYGKRELLERMDPFLGGGEMIRSVTYEESTWNDLPWKFEAGTPNVEGAVGLAAAIDYINEVVGGVANIQRHEHDLVQYAMRRLREAFPEIRIYGPEENRAGILAFTFGDLHPHDVATVLDSEGVAIRAGHHCTMPLHREVLQVVATNRASFYVYNTREDVDRLVEALGKVKEFFSHVA
ncbi:MAG: cysteine desulfurase [Bacillota bacterium]|nr:MAG: cysteine desulfurase [Bacillota bacterium]